MRFGQWVNAGSPTLRFWKHAAFLFVVATLTRGALCVVSRTWGWRLFRERPFVSASFWLSCVFLAFGLAVGWAAMGIGKPRVR